MVKKLVIRRFYRLVYLLAHRKKMRRLKNIYLGERCVIVGNGPSLLISDLERLGETKSFGSNRIYSIFSLTEWRPNFYCVQDAKLLEERGDFIKKLEPGKQWNFTPYNYVDSLLSFSKRTNGWTYFWLNNTLKCPEFSDVVEVEVNEGKTVTFSCLQLAVYMGFKRIYLLGVDHTSSVVMKGDVIHRGDPSRDYFKGVDNKGVTKRPYEIEYVERAFNEAKRYFIEKNVEVINLTRGGQLETFKRELFDDVFPN